MSNDISGEYDFLRRPMLAAASPKSPVSMSPRGRSSFRRKALDKLMMVTPELLEVTPERFGPVPVDLQVLSPGVNMASPAESKSSVSGTAIFKQSSFPTLARKSFSSLRKKPIQVVEEEPVVHSYDGDIMSAIRQPSLGRNEGIRQPSLGRNEGQSAIRQPSMIPRSGIVKFDGNLVASPPLPAKHPDFDFL